MSRVFIDPPWKELRKLSSRLVKAYFYCWHKCDKAGVYEYDAAYLQADLNEPIDYNELLQIPGTKQLPNDKILFLEFLAVTEVGIIKDWYNPHKPIFKAIYLHGPEHFADVNIQIEKKIDEKQKELQAIKKYFKLENIDDSLLSRSSSRSSSEVVVEVFEGGMGETFEKLEQEQQPQTPVVKMAGLMDVDLMLEKVLLDIEFKRVYNQHYQLNEDTLRLWLQNFNKWLKYTGEANKTETDYRKHFMNWLPRNLHTKPENFKLLNDANSRKHFTETAITSEYTEGTGF